MKINNHERLIEHLNKYKNYNDIKDNFKRYISLCDKENILDFFNAIKSIPNIDKLVRRNLKEIYNLFGIEIVIKATEGINFKDRFHSIKEMYHDLNIEYKSIDFITDLINVNGKEYVSQKMSEIIENVVEHKDIFKTDILKKLKNLDPEGFNKKDVHEAIIRVLTNRTDDSIDKILAQALTIIVDEISKNEDVDLSDIELINENHTTISYKLGSKIIKFGNYRETPKIPYHKRILQPLLRRQIKTNSILWMNKYLYVEIAEYLGKDESITDEDVYRVYKELREDGIIWFDAGKENLGRLKKDNIVHFREPLYVEKETLGFIPKTIKQEEPLHRGELVITETDEIYTLEGFMQARKDHRINPYVQNEYEIRYQKEQTKQLANESKENNRDIDEEEK